MDLTRRIAALSPAKLALLEEWTRRPAEGVAAIARRRPGEPLLLSFAQERLWFLDQLEPGNPAYNFCGAFRLAGLQDVPALERSLHEIIRRHEALRTTFQAQGGTPLQVIHPDVPLRLVVRELQHVPPGRHEAMLQDESQRETAHRFDLRHGPLLRAVLLRFSEAESVLLVTVHHIVSDGWSMAIFARELGAVYADVRQGEAPRLPELPIQYPDFALWQRRHLRGRRLRSLLSYWKRRLAGSPRLFQLPADRPRPALQSSRGELLAFTIPAAATTALAALGRRQGATFFMTLLAGFDLLLHRLTGEDRVLVGSPIANRTRTEIENLIGFFANTLVLAADLGGEPSFHDLLRRVQEVTLGAYTHQDLPFEKLVQELQPERDLSHNPLFQVMFVLQSGPEAEVRLSALPAGDAARQGGPSTHLVTPGAAKFDLTLSLSGDGADLRGVLEYSTDLFDTVTMIRLKEHLLTLWAAIAGDPGRPVSRLPWSSAAERHQILVEWNDSAAEPSLAGLPAGETVDRYLTLWAGRQPNARALVSEEGALTYRELERRVEHQAARLRGLGVGPEVRVGLCLPRSADGVTAVLAIWRAGGAYVPIDPSLPAPRLSFLLADSAAEVLVTRRDLLPRLPSGTGVRVVCIDEEPGEDVTLAWHGPAAALSNLAYVIYTSGSTGRPKGVLVGHLGLRNLVGAHVDLFGPATGRRILLFASLSFDASAWEIILGLHTGSTLYVPAQETLQSPGELAELLHREAVDLVTVPPALLAVLPETALPRLRTVISAADVCPPELIPRWSPGRLFFNAYGPTEATICTTVDHLEPWRSRPAIGRTLRNVRSYIVDRRLEPVPVGSPGELCLGGIVVARGYLGRPELTAERFIPDPFAPPTSGPGERLYRTGDLTRHLPDGRIEFLGRIDQQVKLRGVRIEPGEIEAELRTHEGVREAVVAVTGSAAGSSILAAWVVPSREPPPAPAELRAFLRERLPEYMVPTALMIIPALPVTLTGKLDRFALPRPADERPETGAAFLPPSGAAEEAVAQIWAEVLGLQRIGAGDDFFELGGHSLLATQVVSRIRNLFAVEVPLRLLFERPTVRELAAALPGLPADPPRGQPGGTGGTGGIGGIVPVPRTRHRTTLAALAAERGEAAAGTPAGMLRRQTP